MKKHNKRYIRILSALLSIITLMCMLPVPAIAIDTSLKNSPEYASNLNEFDTINGAYTDEDDLVDSFQEDTSMRSEHAKHYVNSSGKRYMVVFPEQVHYLEDDTWKEVNNTLTLDSYKKEYISSNPKFITRFSKEANSSKLVTIEDGNYSLSWTIFFESNKKETMSSTAIASDSATSLQSNAASVSARVVELNAAVTDSVKTKETITQLGKALSNISYSGVFNRSVDLRYSVLHGKVEEDVILNTPDSLSSYTLIIDTHGLMASKLADNTVVFLTSEGKEIFRLAAPWMKDSGIAVSDAIDVSVVQKENTAFITYTPNQEWLQDSSRVYPVLIDPSFTTRFYTSNYEDTYVYSGDSASTTRPTETTMKVGNISGSTYYAYCKIKNIPEFVGGTGYPDNVTFTIWANTTSSPALSLYQVTGNWSPSSITYANQPGASLITSGITGIVNGSNSKYSFDLTSWLQYSLRDEYGDPLYYNVWDFFKSSDWHGFKLGYTTNLTGNYTQIYSSEHSTASYRPVMTVEYTYWPYGGIENDAVFSFINSASGKYLTVDNGNTDNGTNVYQYTKNNTLSQAFRLYYEESDNCFRIRAMCSSDGRGSVLEVPSFSGTINSSGYTNSNVRLYSYGASFRDDQQWIIYPHNSSSGLYKIVLRADPGLALTAYGTENGTASGTTSTSAGNVFVSQFTGAANQLWKIESGGIQLFPTIDIRKETGKSMEYYENRNWYSFCCPVTNFGDTVTWSSSNTQSLIVDSVGRVSSLTAGESVLCATVRHADGTYDYYTITFYVTIPDGTYYLNDKANNYRLEYESLSNLSENAVLESFNSGTDEPTSRGRFYKIKYLGDGLYSIRSLLDCSMGWTRSGTSLVMTTIGTLDKDVPDVAKWKIKSNANGYYIHSKYGTSKTVTAGSSSGINIELQSYSSTNTRQNWEIKKITKSYHGITFKKTVSTVAIGESKQFMAGIYSTYTNVNGQKGITWSVANGTGSASIDSTTGVLTGIAQGSVTVKATFKPNSYQSYEATYILTVIPVQEGIYFIRNRHYGKYIQVDDDDAPTYNNNGGIIEQWTLNRENYQKWRIIYVSDGYYKIVSFVSGFAITVPTGQETNADISLILKPYTGSTNQLWQFIKTAAGNYKIKAKSSNTYTSKDLAMRVNTKGLHSENGLNIMQMPYSNDTDYVDEWRLEKTKGKAIIIVPGITCSSLQNDNGEKVWLFIGRQNQIACDENGNSVNNIYPYNPDNYGILDMYKNVFDTLTSKYSSEYDVIFFAYDWRITCADAAEKLETLTNYYDSCIMVAHSMGGVVVSSYLSRSQANRDKVDKFISVGTPYTGAPKALYVMETGRLMWITEAALNLSEYAKNIPALYELFPTEKYFRRYSRFIEVNGVSKNGYTTSWSYMKTLNWAKKENGTVKPMFNAAESFHDSLYFNGIHVAERSDVNTFKIIGVGEDTITTVVFDSNNKFDFCYYSEGDGTVPTYSALNNVDKYSYKTYAFFKDHTELIKYDGCIKLIIDIINDVPYVYYDPGTTTANTSATSYISNGIMSDDVQITDNRITIVTKNIADLNIYTKDGNIVYSIGDKLFYNDTYGNKHRVGSAWSLGDNSMQYVLFNDQYTVNNIVGINENSSIRLDYCNYGLSERCVKYENINGHTKIQIKKWANGMTTQDGIYTEYIE